MQAGKSSIDAQAVMAELELILASREFQGLERRRWLLRYLVERALAGAEKIGEAEIQSAAAQGPGGFSFGGVALPVELRLLRESLREYYRRESADRAVRISIPARSCVPVFASEKGEEERPPRALPLRRVSIALALLVFVGVGAWLLWRQHRSGVESSRLSADATRRLRVAIRSGPPGGFLRIADMFRQATAADSKNGEAWAGLAEALAASDFQGLTRDEAVDEARRAATQAIRLGGNLAAAHGALGYVKLMHDWDWDGAESEFREALRLDPSLPEVHAWYAKGSLITGKFDQALAEFRISVPNPVYAAPSVAQVLCSARRYDEGIAEARRGVDGAPASVAAPMSLGICLAAKGDYPGALAAFQQAAGRSQSAFPLARMAQTEALMGDRQGAEAILTQFQREAEKGLTHHWVAVALIFAGLGDTAKAVDCLEKAVQWREPEAVFIGVDPAYERIRSDARFQALRKRLRLP